MPARYQGHQRTVRRRPAVEIENEFVHHTQERAACRAREVGMANSAASELKDAFESAREAPVEGLAGAAVAAAGAAGAATGVGEAAAERAAAVGRAASRRAKPAAESA